MCLLNFGQIAALAVDPIEKKPFYHYYPGRQVLSVGSWGCNFRCQHCQNWQLSQQTNCREVLLPEALAELTNHSARQESSICGLAYTYNEPLVGLEYLVETATLVSKHNLKNLLVSNGYINPGPLQDLLPFLDAANIDIKAFNDVFYHKICGNGRLQPVLRTVEALLAANVHVELTWLVIPGQNDSEADIASFVDWLLDLGVEIPVHFSAYFPRYQATWPPTDLALLDRLKNEVGQRLPFVYLGNTGRRKDSNIICPDCGNTVLNRQNGCITIGINAGECSICHRKIPGQGFF
jgi:pyruvate formate lyase activating enzyme